MAAEPGERTDPLLTIAIPTLNRRKLLVRAVESAMAQTTAVEIIVSDNGSSDDTPSYLASLDCPANMYRFRNDTTIPVQKHGDFILSKVCTPWVVFLSDDDYLEPDFAAEVTRLVEEQKDIDLVYTGCDLLFGDIAVPAKVGPRVEAVDSFFYEFMDGKRNICMCATAFRAVKMRSIGPLPPSILIGDMYYWTRILARGTKVGCVDKHLSNYFFYRPGMTTETNKISVSAWVQESDDLAALMCQSILRKTAGRYHPSEIRRVRHKFISRTTANQFAWNALRGAGKYRLVISFFRLAPRLFRDFPSPLRAIAAILLPRPLLEGIVITRARQMAAIAIQEGSRTSGVCDRDWRRSACG